MNEKKVALLKLMTMMKMTGIKLMIKLALVRTTNVMKEILLRLMLMTKSPSVPHRTLSKLCTTSSCWRLGRRQFKG